MTTQPPSQTCLTACYRPRPSPSPPQPVPLGRWCIAEDEMAQPATHKTLTTPSPQATLFMSANVSLASHVGHYKVNNDMPHLLRVCQCLLDPVPLRHVQPLLHCRALHDPVPPGGHIREGPVEFYTCIRAKRRGSAEGVHHATLLPQMWSGSWSSAIQTWPFTLSPTVTGHAENMPGSLEAVDAAKRSLSRWRCLGCYAGQKGQQYCWPDVSPAHGHTIHQLRQRCMRCCARLRCIADEMPHLPRAR